MLFAGQWFILERLQTLGLQKLRLPKLRLQKLSMMVPPLPVILTPLCCALHMCITYVHYVCASAAQELAPEIAARIAEAERIAAEAEAEAAAYAEHAAAIQAEHDLQQQQEHQVHPLTCLCFGLLMIPSRRALALSC